MVAVPVAGHRHGSVVPDDWIDAYTASTPASAAFTVTVRWRSRPESWLVLMAADTTTSDSTDTTPMTIIAMTRVTPASVRCPLRIRVNMCPAFLYRGDGVADAWVVAVGRVPPRERARDIDRLAARLGVLHPKRDVHEA